MKRAGSTSMATLVALCGVAAAGGAWAAPATIAWSTYVRAGPGIAYRAIDELEHDAVVDLRGCGGAWCRVVDGRTVGYVDKEALTLPRLPAGAPAGTQSCFTSGQASYRVAAPTRFCAAAGAVSPTATRLR